MEEEVEECKNELLIIKENFFFFFFYSHITPHSPSGTPGEPLHPTTQGADMPDPTQRRNKTKENTTER